MLKTAGSYLHSSGGNIRTWRTDGRTDRSAVTITALALRAVRMRCKNDCSGTVEVCVRACVRECMDCCRPSMRSGHAFASVCLSVCLQCCNFWKPLSGKFILVCKYTFSEFSGQTRISRSSGHSQGHRSNNSASVCASLGKLKQVISDNRRVTQCDVHNDSVKWWWRTSRWQTLGGGPMGAEHRLAVYRVRGWSAFDWKTTL